MRCRALAALVAGTAVLAGCGLGSGKDQGGGADLRVTRDFGQRQVAAAKRDSVREGDTVMRFLQSEQKVTLRYGGGFVQSIDGLTGRGATGSRDWFYWVNGKEGSVGAADSKLHPGDVVQWDYRDWAATMSIPAIVGAFPEPFVHGLGGKKQPVRLECADANAHACNSARDRLAAAGIIASGGTLGTAERGQVARILVGPWSDLRGLRVLRIVEQGPQASGVFARFAQNGTRLDLLDARGRVAERGGPGAGLVAAVRIRQEESIVFIVTGTDAAGVESAAEALTPDKLRDAFAVTTRGPSVRKLPFVAGAG
jgi:hypothetical protein